MSASKVTVFPVPVPAKENRGESDPATLAGEIERLRGENAVLRERLASVHAIALEREETIEDLRHALRMLPSVWAERLDEETTAPDEQAEGSAASPAPARPADAAPAPQARPTSPPDAFVDQAEVLFAEVAALRARLERRRLEAEQEILEQERRRLLADIEWTRAWQRSRGLGRAEA